MGSEDDTRDRVIALERDVAHLSDKVGELTDAVKTLTLALEQARGGWKILLAVLTAAGSLGAGIAQIVPWASLFR